MGSLRILEDFPLAAKRAHFKRSRPFQKTSIFVRHSTKTMSIMSSRGYRAGTVPTRRHTPPQQSRRYSIDVNTHNWEKSHPNPWMKEAEHNDIIMSNIPVLQMNREIDEPVRYEPSLKLPDPRRFPALYPWVNVPMDYQTFLELPHSSLTNEDFNVIRDIEHESWFRDSILDVALELLSIEYNCSANAIEIAPSTISTIMYHVSVFGDTDGNNFACYKEEKARFANKRWIFLPINDGMMARDAAQVQGVHWSLVAIDREAMQAHYFDSLMINNENYQALAHSISHGVGSLLGETYDLVVEFASPHQECHNGFTGNDPGPCGPFVYEMASRWVQMIRRYQDHDLEQDCFLTINEDFGLSEDWSVNSWETRYRIWFLVGQKRRQLASQEISEEHDREALASIEGTIVLDTPQRDVRPVSEETEDEEETQTEDETTSQGEEIQDEKTEHDIVEHEEPSSGDFVIIGEEEAIEIKLEDEEINSSQAKEDSMNEPDGE